MVGLHLNLTWAPRIGQVTQADLIDSSYTISRMTTRREHRRYIRVSTAEIFTGSSGTRGLETQSGNHTGMGPCTKRLLWNQVGSGSNAVGPRPDLHYVQYLRDPSPSFEILDR